MTKSRPYKVWKKKILAENSQCQGSGVEITLSYSRNSKEPVELVEEN